MDRKQILKSVFEPKDNFGIIFHYYEDGVLVKTDHVLNGVTLTESKYNSLPKTIEIDFTENRLTIGKKSEKDEK